ncbi:probable LRR receptor-like serine/threonine-protein kinase At1g05700 [Syzygium oleosum]|uniref:probable LRR receptor-like serine/threonine-protein kinase At1g05700 n=1 Tax=Syzygium oleosum TaxID=219896 RepID=UPI0024BB07DF|nr:probable LRR receptor-like serine/threonine-protein kinase At1g05700 [Syzygium oleosum]
MSVVHLYFLRFSIAGKTTLLRIDCGTDSSYRDSTDGSYWQSDENYIKTGTNRKVSTSRIEQFNSLRAFTQQNKNCYTLPTPTQAKYFIRGSFYYGNYDGQSKPPTFDLEFDGNKWASVVTSATRLQFHELIYMPKGENISVCLARTQDKQFPFISILEIWPLDDNMYEGMSGDVAWLRSYGYNYGGGSNDLENWILGFPMDDYNRVWQPYDPPGINVVTALSISQNNVNDPPEEAIITAIEAADPADVINLPFTLATTTNLNYIAAYFTEPHEFLDNDTRLIDIYVEDDFMLTVEPEIGICTCALIRIQSDGTLNVQLRQNGSSTLPPVISAIEVYTAGNPLVPGTTSKDDLDGLQVFINAFEQLSGWSGDPCLPNNTVWQWLGCNGNDPPRVSKIDLSGYGLNGPLPEFSQMQALETM